MIDTEKDNRKLVERAIIIGLQNADEELFQAREHLNELKELVKNLDIPVIEETIVRIKDPKPKFYIGTGKAEEILELAKELKADCLIFDGELSASQQRNWEKFTKICVIDRQEVILDIFANRAITREAVLQVRLARMQYSLPRLTRAWTHLSRQRGGNKGTRGEGEKQIEADRRMVQNQITSLRRELEQVKRHRETQRKSRERREIPLVAIVGYTNAGKSSLLHKITGADILVEDKLFATLDPTTKKVQLPGGQQILMSDTVGFVRKLPHSLVEAFKSTLEEAALADSLLLVLDISNNQFDQHWETTMEVLKELGAEEKNIRIVFNKIDLQHDPVVYAKVANLFPNHLRISTHTGEGINELLEVLAVDLSYCRQSIKLQVPPERYDIVALAHQFGEIIDSDYDDAGNNMMVVNIDNKNLKKFAQFIVKS
ncbi:GTPase HflX [Lentisphaerota bacterium WC36G]|nr:GTPase HflX [Lentisphaerae bacterium WC36]